VLGSDVPLRMVGLDLTYQFVMDDALERDIRAIGTDAAAVMADLIAGYLDTVPLHTGKRQGGLHDPCAILAVTHPEVIRSTPRHVDIELTGSLTRGMTVVDQRGRGVGGIPNVLHGHTLDYPAARAIVIDAIRARGSGGPR
jgi:inosine-uridine nucleoside N-ribohydrolase